MFCFTILRENILSLLERPHKIADPKASVPALSHVLLRLEGKTLTAIGTNMDMQISNKGECEDVTAEGTCVVPAKTLYDIIKKMPKSCLMKLDGRNEGTLKIQAARSKFNLATLPDSDFPLFKKEDNSHHFTLFSSKDIAHLLKMTEFSVSNDETRYYLCGIKMHVIQIDGNDYLKAVSTDGYRLATAHIPLNDNQKNFVCDTLLPRYLFDEMISCLSLNESVHMSITQNNAFIKIGNLEIVSKLIDGVFPDYERVIPFHNNIQCTISKDEFEKCIERIMIITSGSKQKIDLKFDNNNLSISSYNPDAGQANELIDCEYIDTPLTLSVDSKFLLEILKVNSSQFIKIFISDEKSPLLIKGKDDENSLFVLMTMK